MTSAVAALPAFYAVTGPGPLDAPQPRRDIAVRTRVRALDKMLKEALVTSAATGVTWRMLSDEGDYLAGTDLAPPPLGFFAAGAAAANADAICALARDRQIALPGLRITQDTYYTMEGSALRGTMVGGALPPELLVEADVPEATLRPLVTAAVDTTPYSGLLHGAQDGHFALVLNGVAVDVGRVRPHAGPAMPDPAGSFDRLAPTLTDGQLLTKVPEASQPKGEASSSLRAEQSRKLHVRAVCTVREDGVRVIDHYLFQPAGSHFRLLADHAGRAPDAATYLSAGLGFCYMTQIGRYAKITKRALGGYRIVQDTHFGPGSADPVQTHVFLDLPDGPDAARQMVDMGEQTCFLHAACRTDLRMTVRVTGRAA